MRDARHRKPVLIGPRCKNDGGGRRSTSIRYIVIHDAEAPSDAAQGVANYGARTNNSVSWHVVVDDNMLIRQLPDLVIGWAAPPLNTNGLQIEMCGYARYSALQWWQHRATLYRAAWQVAKWCRDYKIPPRWLSDVELDEGEKKGIVTHAQVSRVYKKSDHTDPGEGFNKVIPEHSATIRRWFMSLVRRRLKWLNE